MNAKLAGLAYCGGVVLVICIGLARAEPTTIVTADHGGKRVTTDAAALSLMEKMGDIMTKNKLGSICFSDGPLQIVMSKEPDGIGPVPVGPPPRAVHRLVQWQPPSPSPPMPGSLKNMADRNMFNVSEIFNVVPTPDWKKKVWVCVYRFVDGGEVNYLAVHPNGVAMLPARNLKPR
jgi:hypothetical protein